MSNAHQNFSILFRLNRQRCRDGKPAIYLRLTVDYKRIELATNQYIETDLWDHKAQCAKGKSEQAQAINRLLTNMEAELNKHHSRLLALDKPINAEALKNLYLGIGVKQRSLKEALDFFISRFAEKVNTGKKATNTLKKRLLNLDKKRWLNSHLNIFIMCSYQLQIDISHHFSPFVHKLC